LLASDAPEMPGPADTRNSVVDPVSLDDIRRAAGRLQGHVEDTPCLHSRTLSEIVGAEVYLKFENLQFTAGWRCCRTMKGGRA
jgi:hypothetical protein